MAGLEPDRELLEDDSDIPLDDILDVVFCGGWGVADCEVAD